MKRGDLVTVALTGDFGKPRPALIIQSDHFTDTDSVTLMLLSATPVDAPLIRPEVTPTPENGLHKRSQIMMDKTITVRRNKLGKTFGRLDSETMIRVNRALALFLGLA